MAEHKKCKSSAEIKFKEYYFDLSPTTSYKFTASEVTPLQKQTNYFFKQKYVTTFLGFFRGYSLLNYLKLL